MRSIRRLNLLQAPETIRAALLQGSLELDLISHDGVLSSCTTRVEMTMHEDDRIIVIVVDDSAKRTYNVHVARLGAEELEPYVIAVDDTE